MWVVLAVTVTLTCVLLAHIILQKRGGKASLSRLDLPRLPRPVGLPILGNVELLAPNFHRVLSGWADRHGHIYRIRVFGMDGVVVSDPAAVGKILGHDHSTPDLPKHTVIYQVLDQLWGDGKTHSIFTDLSTENWKLVRKAVSPAFSSSNIRHKFDMLRGKAADLANAMLLRPSEQMIDIDEAGMRLTLDVVGLAGFGHDFGSVSFEENGIINTLPLALAELQKRMTNPFQIFSMSQESRAAMRCVRGFRCICRSLTAELRNRGPPDGADMSIGAQLLRARHPVTGKGLTDAQLTAEVGTFIMGGFETTAHTLAFALFSIATNPEVETKLLQELGQLGLLDRSSAPGRQLQHDDLRKLTYTGNIIKEAMRKYPVVAGFPRYTDKETIISGYRIPKGVFVYVLFHHMHNSARLWHQPDQFCPERWDTEDGSYIPEPNTTKAKADHTAGAAGHHAEVHLEARAGDHNSNAEHVAAPFKKFLPFSDGPRSCPGQAMAMMELKVAVATLYSKFSFRLAECMGGPEGVAASEIMALTLHTRHGISMHCLPRSSHFPALA